MSTDVENRDAGMEDWVVGADGSSHDIAWRGEGLPWRWQEGEYTVTRTAAWSAPGCHEGCGVLLYTDKDGEFVKLEGDKDNPFNRGTLCIRCLAFDQTINHPDRLKFPMKRAKEDRGKNKFERITWEEAYDTIEQTFNKFKEESGPESVIFASGTGRDIASGMYRMCYAFGSPNPAYLQTGVACYGPRISATSIMMGNYCVPDASMYFGDRYNNPQWKPPGVIFIWGNNPTVSNADGNLGHWMVECMKLGSKLVVVDPRLTWFSAKADLFLQIRPGTDAALALGIMNEMIKEDIYDHEFVDLWTSGFDDLKEVASKYTLEETERLTWVPKEKIKKAAQMTALSPMAIQWGLALDQTREAIPGSMSLVALWSLTGDIDVPGGMVTTHQPFGGMIWQPPAVEDYLPQEVIERRIGYDEFPLYKYSGCVVCQPDITLDACITGEPYAIRGAWLQSTNPLSCCSQQPEAKVLKALSNIEFNVNVDIFMTPTAMATADIVLPVATFAEKNSMRAIWYYMQPINKAVDKADNDVRSDLQINLDMARRWNAESWPWETIEDFFSAMTEASTGLDYEQIRDVNWIYPKFEYQKYKTGKQRADGGLGFNTPSGRIEFNSSLLKRWGFESLPTYHEPDESPLATPSLMEEYPLILTTGARNWSYFHSEGRQIPRLRAVHPNPIVQIHPETAKKYGISEGDWTWVENELGKIKMVAEISIVVSPAIVNIDHAWWFPESDPENLFDTFSSNANQLVPTDYGTTGFGANCKSLICKISKVKDSEVQNVA